MRHSFCRQVSRIAALSLPLALTAPLVTQAATPSAEVTPFIAYGGGGSFVEQSTNNNTGVKAKSGLALAFNWRATDTSEYELFYSRHSTQTDSTTPLGIKVEYLHIGGLTEIGATDARVVPYAVAGVGATRFSPDALSSKTLFSANFGLGARISLAKHVRLRFEARGYGTVVNNQSCLFENASGCLYKSTGSDVFLQYEALGGISVAF